MTDASSRLEDFLPYRLSITTNAVSQTVAAVYRARFGLKIPEWRVMAVLGDSGPLTQRELVGATLMDKVAVNRACKFLVERGLVVRRPNPHDGRSHRLELSEAGRRVHAEVMPLALDIESKLFDSLSEAERRQLRAILDRLLHRAREMERSGP